MMRCEEKIKELKLEVPSAPKPIGSYRPVVVYGNQAFLSGQISKAADGRLFVGKLGQELSLEDGQEAAKVAALNVVGVIRDLVGFEKFDRILRLVGYVQAAEDFYEIPQVVNGASDLLGDIFGEQGIHARSAVGIASLPLNVAVELEVTIGLK